MGKNLNTYKTFNINERTPPSLYTQLDNEFHFNFDPCPINSVVDGLSIPWYGNVFVNPPYGKATRAWLEKGLLELQLSHCTLEVFLLPAYTDVKWFHDIVLPNANEIRFIKGRLKFGDHNESAPFGSMLVVFKNITPL